MVSLAVLPLRAISEPSASRPCCQVIRADYTLMTIPHCRAIVAVHDRR